jgi:hypothetical protein
MDKVVELKVKLKVVSYIFLTIIRIKNLDPSRKLSLNHSMK